MTYTSQILYHLVGGHDPKDNERNFDVLCKVLTSNEVKHKQVAGNASPMVTSVDYSRAMTNGEPIVQSVTCFCDIPIQDLHPIHTSKYGLFGVGVDRGLVAKWGGRPVIYVPVTKRNPTAWGNRFGRLALGVRQALDHYFGDNRLPERTKVEGEFPKTASDAVDDASDLLTKDFLAYLKFFDVDLSDNDAGNFYMEREWRKFGSLRLEMTLRQILVASGYRERLLSLFPHLIKVPIIELTT